MSLGVFALSILDSVRLGGENLMELSDLSISDLVPAEIMRSWSNGELQDFISLVSKASKAALDKLIKYIGPNGLHPGGLQFLRDVQYFNPETSLLFTEKGNLSIPGFDSIPIGEQVLYRDLVREFLFSPLSDDVTRVKHLQRKIRQIGDFWQGNAGTLPKLYVLARNYGFAIITSATVERSFSLCDNIFVPERRRPLTEETLSQLMFLCYNLS